MKLLNFLFGKQIVWFGNQARIIFIQDRVCFVVSRNYKAAVRSYLYFDCLWPTGVIGTDFI